jgi:phosphate transport system ATP-binding protein
LNQNGNHFSPFQSPNPFPLSIRKNLEFPRREHGVTDPYQLSVVVKRRLHEVDLWDEIKDRLEAPAQSVSGGQH